MWKLRWVSEESLGIYKLSQLGELSFGKLMLKLGELGELRTFLGGKLQKCCSPCSQIMKLGEMSFGIYKLAELNFWNVEVG